MENERIKEIGFWVVEALLVIGATVCGIADKNEIASICAGIVILLFVFRTATE